MRCLGVQRAFRLLGTLLGVYLLIGVILAPQMVPSQQWFCAESTRSQSPYDLGEASSDGGWITEDPWSPSCEALNTRGERATDYALLTVVGPVLFVLKGLSQD
jgi:hypothetical protein